MDRKPIELKLEQIPHVFHPFVENAAVFDSSCSWTAQVLFIDKDEGYYLKSADAGSLAREAAMTRYFHEKGLAAEVLAYEQCERDWLLTRRVPGEDCTHGMYLAQPERLCDTLAQRLRSLHEMDASDCPGVDKMDAYRALAEVNYQTGQYDKQQFPNSFGYASAEEAWRVIGQEGYLLKSDTLLHGDYCLPNIILDDWCFSGFIDVDHGGLGDRHIDLFWGIWSLRYNLKTDRYKDRFLDAYGRDKVETEMLRIVAAYEVFG